MTSANPASDNNNDQNSRSRKSETSSPDTSSTTETFQNESSSVGGKMFVQNRIIENRSTNTTSSDFLFLPLKNPSTDSTEPPGPPKPPETSKFNNRKDKQHEQRDWLELLIAPGIIALIGLLGTWVWDMMSEQAAAQRYREGLVKDYIESVKGLVFDQYHGENKNPEVKVEEVESFVRSKTALTLRAINADSADPKQTTVLINFLKESGIGFISRYDYNFTSKNQDICLKNLINIATFTKLKNIIFHHFLCGIQLDHVKLEEADLREIILEGANLNNANLKGTKLDNADLERADLSEANLQEAGLIKANLRGAWLTSANLMNAKLNNANLREARFASKFTREGTETKKTNLSNAVLVGVNLIDATLKDVNLSNADLKPHRFEKKDESTQPIIPTNLKGANLEGANLMNADLRMANLRGANLKGAIFTLDTNFKGAIYDQYTCFPEYMHLNTFDSNKFPHQHQMLFILSKKEDKRKNDCNNGRTPNNLGNADLRGADLRDADLRNADLREANLRKTDLRGADLSGVKLPPVTNLENALYDKKTNLPFSGDRKAQEKEAENRGMLKIEPETDLNRVDSSGKVADLSGQDLTGVDLSGAKLQNADLSNVELDGKTKLEGSFYDQDTKLPFSQAEARRRKMIYTPHLPFPLEDDEHTGERNPVDLRKYNLERGDFSSMSLKRANLSENNLKKANLTNTDLTGANLRDTDLTDANLSRTDLRGANLRGAIFSSPQEDKEDKENKDKDKTPLSWLAWTKFEGALYDDKTKLPFSGKREEQETEAKKRGMVKK